MKASVRESFIEQVSSVICQRLTPIISWSDVSGQMAETFLMKDFSSLVRKFIRKDHVQTIQHRMHGQAIDPNQLKESI